MAPRAQKLLTRVVDFFGDDVESDSVEFQLGDPETRANFFSDLVVRNRTTRSTAISRKIWPEADWQMCPGEDSGPRLSDAARNGRSHTKIVGRFPLDDQSRRTVGAAPTHAQRQVAFSLELPEIAAPNLATGTLLTWDYTTRPSFGTVKPAPYGCERRPHDRRFAERLGKKINVEFKNEFLFAGLECFIGGEIGVKFDSTGRACSAWESPRTCGRT